MNHLDLFSGIGGVSLGLERAGFRTVGFCEVDPWRRERLRQNFPGRPIFRDIRHVTARAARTLGQIDIVSGSFPCQDVSLANTAAQGLAGARSSLVFELLRVISEIKPHWCLIENVLGLRTRGADRVLHELEAFGYACWPLVVGARHVSAPHRRDRVWIVAHADRARLRNEPRRCGGACWEDTAEFEDDALANTNGPEQTRRGRAWWRREWREKGNGVGKCKNAPCADGEPWGDWNGGPSAHLRLDDGLPVRLARRQIAAYGDSVVPQVVEAIGRAIIANGGKIEKPNSP